MKLRSLIAAAALTAGLSVPSAFAATISSFTGSVSTTNATQLGRPSRNGQPQTWTGVESYPGVLATSVNTSYFYTTYTLSRALFYNQNYVDISVFDESNSGLFFVSAYYNSYNPNSRGTNWLGDEGGSGNIFNTDARDFEVLLPYMTDLVLVVNTTGGGTSGTGYLYDVAINAYADSQFDDAAPTPMSVTPEPSTVIELGTGMLAAAGVVRRRLRLAA